MRGLMSLLGILIVATVGLFVYRSYFTGPGDVTQGTGNPRAAADITGVKSDLLGMAQAERAYMALNGRYASLADLRTSGDLLVDPARGRQGYAYSSQISDRSFSITATYTGPAANMPTLSIDESMQIAEH